MTDDSAAGSSREPGVVVDPDWPPASSWLSTEHISGIYGTLAVVGAPLVLGAITPGRFDLAPRAVREALNRFSTYDFTARHDLRELAVHDYGDLSLQSLHPAAILEPLSGAVRNGVAHAQAMVILGGHNGITWAAAQGLTPSLENCGLLTVDAHLDLRTLEGGLLNGNPVRALLEAGLPGSNVAQVGIQSFANSPAYAELAADRGITVVTVEEVRRRGIEEVIGDVLDRLCAQTDAVYVDLDLDVLDRPLAPATAGARPGGLTAFELRQAANLCGRHPGVLALDVVEIDPTRDVGEVTVMTAAACLLAFASGLLARVKDSAGVRSD